MLAGFKAKNHPQQVALRGADDTVDERITPHRIFRELDFRFRFTLDAAANARNTKCSRFNSIEACGLAAGWMGERVWCNPPYSDLEPWVAKAWHELQHGGCPLSVLMVPANRAEQGWWQRWVEPRRDGAVGQFEFSDMKTPAARATGVVCRPAEGIRPEPQRCSSASGRSRQRQER